MVASVFRSHKRALAPLELEFKAVMSHLVEMPGPNSGPLGKLGGLLEASASASPVSCKPFVIPCLNGQTMYKKCRSKF